MGCRVVPQREFPTHRQWVAGFCCIVPGCPNKARAAHYDGEVPYADAGGERMKRHDKWCFPCCDDHHMLRGDSYHVLGVERFEKLYGVNTKKAAENMARTSPHRWRWENHD
jgi:hypothetical protein